MDLTNKAVFITGANRGIGLALAQEALVRGAAKVYASARNLDDLTTLQNQRVIPVSLDITRVEQAEQAAKAAADTDLLINNAGALFGGSITDSSDTDIRLNMDVNYFGTLNVIRAFLPGFKARRSGAIATISSIIGLANSPALGAYSASKAALFSAIQDLRAKARPYGIVVFGIFPGPIDTDMTRAMAMKKHDVTATAKAIYDGISAEQLDIFPDPASSQMGALWMKNPKELEKVFGS